MSTAKADEPTSGDLVTVRSGFWTFIAADAGLFLLLFLQFSLDRVQDRNSFITDQGQLHPVVALINTLVLITGSWFAASAVHALSMARHRTARRLTLATFTCGAVFVPLKISEYIQVAQAGHSPTTSTFFMYYFVITGIHLLHLFGGIVALLVAARQMGDATEGLAPGALLEPITVYWHLVDVLWIFIFPLLYLVR